MTEKDNNSHLKIGELPTLRVLPIGELTFHEEPHEERFLKLVNRFGTEGILKNPPIVAEIEHRTRQIILDGANRVTALTKLGFKHILVQVVDFNDPMLKLRCWNHAIEKLDEIFFRQKIQQITGLELIENTPGIVIDNDTPDFLDRSHSFLCQLTFRNGRTVSIASKDGLIEQVKQLNEIVHLYVKTHLFDRVSYTNLEDMRKHYPDFCTMIAFRQFDKADFLQLVNSGEKLPAGVTRVFLPKRALGLNVQLEFLKSNLTLQEKNHWLEEMILSRVRDKSIRFYREPTFVFDE